MLSVRELTVRYRTRSKPAVNKVSFELGDNEFILLAGASGSGKSTAMQALCGFIPDIMPAEVSGTIEMDGRNCSDAMEIARTICMVQQDPEAQFCADTVREEVAFGLENFCVPREEIVRGTEEALRKVNASHLIDRQLSTLSGGEKQKVAIASMLALKPRVIILDEPTSSLDPRAVREVVEAVHTMSRSSKVTTVVVEHRLGDFLGSATRLLMMKDGVLESDQPITPTLRAAANRRMLTLPELHPETPRETVVRVRDLTYRIAERNILHHISLEVNQGAIVALMGQNGAGKTTLLRHLAGLVKPQQGTIKVLGHSMGDGARSDPWKIGKDVGFVFQNPNHQIFEQSVEKEIRFASLNFGSPNEGADKSIRRFEEMEKLSTVVHPQMLSHGQKRRVNIMSSTSHGPRLLLLDEPFIGQDPENESKICGLISETQRSGVTVILVTHDLEIARTLCTDIVLLSEGRLMSAGASKDLLPIAEKVLGGGTR